MKFKVENNFADCLQVYNSLSEQEKKWFGTYDSGGEVIIIHRKLVKVDDKLAGFVEVGECSKIPNGIDGDCIVYVAVAPEYRRREIGFKLVNEVVQNFKENSFKSLTYRVNKKNIASIKLAEKCGLKRLPQDMIFENIRETEYVYIGE